MNYRHFIYDVFGCFAAPLEQIVIDDPCVIQGVMDEICHAMHLSGRDRMANAAVAFYALDKPCLAVAGREVGISREAVRQAVAKFNRNARHPKCVQRLRDAYHLADAVDPHAAPDGWMFIKDASEASTLTMSHLRHLAMWGKVEAKKQGKFSIINAESLQHYVTTPAKQGPKRGIWKEE